MGSGAPPWLAGVRGEQVVPLITSEHPVLRVPAGPGTGKTFGLRKRVLRLLHPTGLAAEPERVLVCSFNRVIAADLRTEIEAELTPHDLRSPHIFTVHSLAAHLSGESPRFLMPQEIEVMIYDVRVANPGIDEQYERRQSRAMRAFREHEAGLQSHPALATAYRMWLTQHGARLVGDLPRQVASELRQGGLLDHRYDHVIVDEFQDLTAAEASLVLALRAEGAQIVVLGDRKQSIYAFRGNEQHGLEALEALVTEPITNHRMDECQRCRSEIVEVSNQVMAIYGEPLTPVRGPGAQLHLVHHRTPEAEHRRMAAEIARVYRERPDDAHLVLVTRRRWGYELRNAIRAVDPEIDAHTVFAEDVLETWPAREAFGFLSVFASPSDAVALRDWIAYREPDENGRAFMAPQRNAHAYAHILESGGVLTLDRALGLAAQPATALRGSGRGHVHTRLRRLRDLVSEFDPAAELNSLVDRILDPDRWVVSDRADELLAREDIGRLHREAHVILESDDPPDGLDVLVTRLRYRIATREPLGVQSDPKVKIVTMWGAKGLTADFVYVIGLCDEALPGPWDADDTGHASENEHALEQLRLLYVSLTRAKKALVVSRPDRIKRGRVAALGLSATRAGSRFWQDLRPCRFFADLDPSVLPHASQGDDWSGIDLDSLPD